MSNFQPTLTINEGIATGWARVEIFGDPDYGKSLIGDGRKVLGMMKSYHGVGQSQVDDNQSTGGGGFFHTKRRLSDGTLIQAITNDGHDTIRIYTPKFGKKEEPVKKKREDEFNPGDYLWIGIRAKDGISRPYYGIDCHLVEPDGSPPFPDRRGVVGAAFGALGAWIDLDVSYGFVGNDADGFELTRYAEGGYSATSIEQLIQTHFDGYTAGDFSSTMQLGDHQGISYVYPADTLGVDFDVAWSFNGICHQYWLDAPVQSHGPYDPLMTNEQNAGGERTFAGMTSIFNYDVRYGWDATFWIDPWDYKIAAEQPSVKMIDKRPLIAEWRKKMREDGFIAPPEQQVKEGNYTLVLHAYNTPEKLQSSRAGQTIPGDAGAYLAGLGPTFDQRSGDCDYQSYMVPFNTFPPLELEVEIRIGRNSMTQREPFEETFELTLSTPKKKFNFDISLSSYDDRQSGTWPFGAGKIIDLCGGDGGPNFGGPSYAAININVKAGTAELGEASDANRVFAASPYLPFRGQFAKPLLVFFHPAFPPASGSTWELNAGTGLFEALEIASSGIFGCAIMAVELNEGQCQALFAGTSSLNVWMFDANTGALTNLGPPTRSAAYYAPYDPPLDSTNFSFYYEKAVQYQNACYKTFGVAVTSVGPFYELSSNYASNPEWASPDCCAV